MATISERFEASWKCPAMTSGRAQIERNLQESSLYNHPDPLGSIGFHWVPFFGIHWDPLGSIYFLKNGTQWNPMEPDGGF